MLQKFYVKEFAGNLMMHLLVQDVDAWVDGTSQERDVSMRVPRRSLEPCTRSASGRLDIRSVDLVFVARHGGAAARHEVEYHAVQSGPGIQRIMTTEVKVLGWSIVLGFVYIFVAAGLSTQQRGLKWNAGNRDGDPKPLSGMAARAGRASQNFLETFVFFAAAVLAVMAAQRGSPQTALGAEIYFWARVVYLPVYIAGIPYLRTVVYAVSLWGIFQVLAALF